uniref:Uncharacterized protein n=1 Tax=Kalanchoe fedtschenkoi TaxID=63787 RepID=A0A7N0ZRG2_KALFE
MLSDHFIPRCKEGMLLVSLSFTGKVELQTDAFWVMMSSKVYNFGVSSSLQILYLNEGMWQIVHVLEVSQYTILNSSKAD